MSNIHDMDSYVFKSWLNDYMKLCTFTPGLGYHIPTFGIEVLSGRNGMTFHKHDMSNAVYSDSITTTVENNRDNGIEYAWSRLNEKHDYGGGHNVGGCYEIVEHKFFQGTSETKIKLNDFFRFVGNITDNDNIKRLALTSQPVPGQKFYRLSFQQLMLIDIIFAMMYRFDIAEHKVTVLDFIRGQLGLGHLSPAKVIALANRLGTHASGYIIPRRCGKTTFSSTMIALCMVFCPAHLKVLYTAQKDFLCKDSYSTVSRGVNAMVAVFNNQQRVLFQHDKEMAERKEGRPFSGWFYEAVSASQDKDKQVTVLFYRKTSETSQLRDTCDRAAVKNVFVAKCYSVKNTLRGGAFNLMFVDETNFINAAVFGEVIPNLSTGLAKLICTSSQKWSQDKREFVDLRDTRMDGVLTCEINYVCPSHCLAFIRAGGMTKTMCMCNMFTQPSHLNTDNILRRLLCAYSLKRGPKITDESQAESKASMLCEIGIVPPGITRSDLDKLQNVSAVPLISQAGRQHLCNARFDVIAALRNPGRYDIERVVVVYLDPTPTSYKSAAGVEVHDRSMHAMTAVCSVMEMCPTTRVRIQKYVILGIEEFTTQQYEPVTHDSCAALTTVFMHMVLTITNLYGGYFRDVILIPEVNSLDLDNMWHKCQLAYRREYYATIVKHDVCIFTPCVVKSQKRKTISGDERVAVAKRKQVVSMMTRVLPKNHMIDQLETMQRSKCVGLVYGNVAYHDYAKATRNDMRGLAEDVEALRAGCRGGGEKLKIGYRMKGDKLQRFLDVHTTTINRSPDSIRDVTLATHMVALSLGGVVELGRYLVEKLDSLAIRTVVSKATGNRSYTISGKRVGSSRTDPRPDDVAVATVMAISLYNEYAFFDPEKMVGETMVLLVD